MSSLIFLLILQKNKKKYFLKKQKKHIFIKKIKNLNPNEISQYEKVSQNSE